MACDERTARRTVGLSSLGSDLRASLKDAAAALVLSGVFFAILAARLAAGVNAAAIEMPDMVRNGGVWAYSASQALGWSALLWSWLTILLGLALPITARGLRARLRAQLEQLHRSMSLTLVGLMLAHALLLLWDKMGDTLVSDFVPWATSYVPGRFPQALGIVSLYMAVLFGLSFYVRDRIGLGLWRVLHRYFAPAVYVLALWHAFAYGSDVKGRNALWACLWAMQAPLAVAFAWRLAVPLGRRFDRWPRLRVNKVSGR
jgi:sulfoxide reductase heme-binding subunit YedZ